MTGQPETRIDKKAVKAWRLSAGLAGLLWFSPAVIMLIITFSQRPDFTDISLADLNWPLWLGFFTAGVCLYGITTFLIPYLRWKRWHYRVDEDEIDLLRGIIISRRTLVPVNRIQHVDTRQGPVFRKFGLSSVAISTAATTHVIPALDDDTADLLRDKISALVRKIKEDV